MSDIRVGLVGRLPEGDANGLSAIAAELDKDPKRLRVGVIIYDIEERQDKVRAGKYVLRASVRRIENIRDAEDGAALQRIMMREFERRTGQAVLPLDLEADVDAAFDGLDINAIEVEEREKAEEHVEHEGASDEWADVLHAMKMGLQPAACGQCGSDIRWDAAYDGWLDLSGFPEAPDGHKHQPAEPEGENG